MEIKINGKTVKLDNRYVVPYCPYITLVYDAHINFEICSSVTAVKYLYKYVYKGHDKAAVSFQKVGGQQNLPDEPQSLDKIKLFLDCRYVSASESVWRVYHFGMHKQYPTVIRLPIHLENKQNIIYDPKKLVNESLESLAKTQLTEYFYTNSIMAEAKNHFYHEFPKYFVWDLKYKTWKLRKK